MDLLRNEYTRDARAWNQYLLSSGKDLVVTSQHWADGIMIRACVRRNNHMVRKEASRPGRSLACSFYNNTLTGIN